MNMTIIFINTINYECLGPDHTFTNTILKGSTAIYAVTEFFEPFAASGANPEAAMKVEFTQGKNLANAANKTAALEHLIWSTLPNALKISNGKYPCRTLMLRPRSATTSRAFQACLLKLHFCG
jgi:NmrA-like family